MAAGQQHEKIISFIEFLPWMGYVHILGASLIHWL